MTFEQLHNSYLEQDDQRFLVRIGKSMKFMWVMSFMRLTANMFSLMN